MFKNIFSLFTLLLPFANAHIFMSYPPSRHNKYSEYYVSNNLVNYNIMAPLLAGPDYFTFPCKGFNKGPSTVTFNSNDIRVTLEGTATHGGGHCQFGISYDDSTFLVLRTVMETCLIDSMSYTFSLPFNTPSGEVTIFWTWVNKIGNREYYMECADVNINNGNTNTNVLLTGLELAVANLPGYPIIPEYPEWDTYNGQDIFDNRKTISIRPDGVDVPILRSPTPSQSSQPLPLPTISRDTNCCIEKTVTVTVIKTDTDTSHTQVKCTNGYMRCNLNDYQICSNGNWINMKCATGTKCKSFNQNYILCDYI